MHDLIMRKKDGSSYTLRYSPERHTLWNGELEVASPHAGEQVFFQRGLTLRIAFGKKCNFSCAYCCQAITRKESDFTLSERENSLSSEALVDGIIAYVGRRKQRLGQIQFWGGETLLYFPWMKKIHAAFMERMPGLLNFFYATNGSLFKGEAFQWTLDKDISVGFSWDGPGQYLRGEDVLRDPEIRGNVLTLLEHGKDRVIFSPTLTNASRSYADIIQELERVLGTSEFSLGESLPIRVSDEASLRAAIPVSELPEFSRKTYRDLLAGNIQQWVMPYYNARVFLSDLGKPITENYTRCFVGSSYTSTIDPQGNIIVCQNFSADTAHEMGEPYCLGSIFDTDKKHVPKLSCLKDRRTARCHSCVVFAICRGGCPYSVREYEEYNCTSYYYQYLPVLGLALNMLTGDILEEVRPAT